MIAKRAKTAFVTAMMALEMMMRKTAFDANCYRLDPVNTPEAMKRNAAIYAKCEQAYKLLSELYDEK